MLDNTQPVRTWTIHSAPTPSTAPHAIAALTSTGLGMRYRGTYCGVDGCRNEGVAGVCNTGCSHLNAATMYTWTRGSRLSHRARLLHKLGGHCNLIRAESCRARHWLAGIDTNARVRLCKTNDTAQNKKREHRARPKHTLSTPRCVHPLCAYVVDQPACKRPPPPRSPAISTPMQRFRSQNQIDKPLNKPRGEVCTACVSQAPTPTARR